MGRYKFKPGNMLYPAPVVMVSCGGGNFKSNIITVAWAGTVCSDPAMVSVSIRKERYSYDIINSTGEFVINLVTDKLVKATDYCGVKSGRDVDKFKETGLTPLESETVSAPGIAESPVCIECKVAFSKDLGTHTMFVAEVTGVTVDDTYMDSKNRFHLEDTGLVAYSHGEYRSLGTKLGSFGYSVRKRRNSGKKK
ncbi:MAG: flavin reductase family protein [Lachnospiraceae bacterium]|nr:flavin reductase family protein [Lachnospiraceae bacterium]